MHKHMGSEVSGTFYYVLHIYILYIRSLQIYNSLSHSLAHIVYNLLIIYEPQTLKILHKQTYI